MEDRVNELLVNFIGLPAVKESVIDICCPVIECREEKTQLRRSDGCLLYTSALELGLSRSTVKRALDDLCRAGLLQKDPRWRENGSLTSNLYHVV